MDDSPAYEGGAGGKIQRRLFRRRALTPYARPASAVRGTRMAGTMSGSGSGWLSKLVDPASRFISGNASWLFSSVFSKRLTAPEEAQEQRLQARADVLQAVDTVPEELDGQAVFNGVNPAEHSGTLATAKIEQLIKQKTYTRSEVDYLKRLIHSRTIEPLGLESECKSDNVFAEENAVRSSRSLSTSAAALSIPRDVAASPAEIAKAYMSARSPRVASSAKNVQRQILPEDRSLSSCGPLAIKANDLGVPPLVPHLSGDREVSGPGSQTPRPRGRSAMYRMSRSPYFKVDPSVNLKWNVYTAVGNTGFSATPFTPESSSKSDCQKALKRGRSTLFSDHGSFGSMSLVSAPKKVRLVPQLAIDGLKGSASPQSLPLVLGQSSEAGRRIFEELDKLAPFPGKESHIKPINRDESPSQLTYDMLNRRALKSMENVDESQFICADANDTSDFLNTKGSQQLQIVENGSSKPDVLGVKVSSSALHWVNKSSSPSIHHSDTTISFPAPISSQSKPAFHMTAPEDFLELDDEHEDVDLSVQSELKTSVSASKNTSVTNSISFGENSKMGNDPENSCSSFKFSVTTESIYNSSPPSTPTIPIPLDAKLVSQVQHTDDKPAETLVSSGTLALDSVDNVAYGGSLTSSRSNGSLHSTSLSSFVSTSVPAVASTTPVSLFFSNGTSADKSQGSLELMSTGSACLVSMGTVPFSGFGSASSTVAPSSSMAAGSAFATSSIFSDTSISNSDSLLPSKNHAIFDSTSAHPVSLSFSTDSGSSPDSLFSQSSTSQSLTSFSSSPILFGSSSSSSSFGLSGSSPGFSNIPFTTANQTTKSSSTAAGIQTSSFSFSSSVGVPNSSSLFSFTTSTSNSSAGLAFSTGTSATSSGPAMAALFGSNSSGSTSSIPSPLVFPPSTGFSFGLAATSSVAPSGFTSSSSIFPFASPSAANSTMSQSNDQMSVEDNMADDTNQVPAPPMFPTFGQSNGAPPSQSFAFGSSFPSGGAPPVFQFGSQQNPTFPQNSNPFAAGGNLDFAPGGSFSLGSGGGEKTGRKFVKVRRDKIKRK